MSINAISQLRDQAERRLKTLMPGKAPAASDPHRLLHKLQVHQIELQMQNEALTETLAQCESLRMKYQDLCDFAPVSNLTLNTKGVVVEFNRAAAKLLGLTRGQPELLRFFQRRVVGDSNQIAQKRHRIAVCRRSAGPLTASGERQTGAVPDQRPEPRVC